VFHWETPFLDEGVRRRAKAVSRFAGRIRQRTGGEGLGSRAADQPGLVAGKAGGIGFGNCGSNFIGVAFFSSADSFEDPDVPAGRRRSGQGRVSARPDPCPLRRRLADEIVLILSLLWPLFLRPVLVAARFSSASIVDPSRPASSGSTGGVTRRQRASRQASKAAKRLRSSRGADDPLRTCATAASMAVSRCLSGVCGRGSVLPGGSG
jgi:hypothetical protein